MDQAPTAAAPYVNKMTEGLQAFLKQHGDMLPPGSAEYRSFVDYVVAGVLSTYINVSWLFPGGCAWRLRRVPEEMWIGPSPLLGMLLH